MGPEIDDPVNTEDCCDPNGNDPTKCACVAPQIDDPVNTGECCDPNGNDPTKCACVAPKIDDPDNIGECCADSGDGATCAVSCPSDQIVEGGKCTSCDDDQIPNPEQDKCIGPPDEVHQWEFKTNQANINVLINKEKKFKNIDLRRQVTIKDSTGKSF